MYRPDYWHYKHTDTTFAKATTFTKVNDQRVTIQETKQK